MTIFYDYQKSAQSFSMIRIWCCFTSARAQGRFDWALMTSQLEIHNWQGQTDIQT